MIAESAGLSVCVGLVLAVCVIALGVAMRNEDEPVSGVEILVLLVVIAGCAAMLLGGIWGLEVPR